MPLAVPLDRQGTFEPQLVERYCRRLPGFDTKVIQRFAHGMLTRHIQRTVQELVWGVGVAGVDCEGDGCGAGRVRGLAIPAAAGAVSDHVSGCDLGEGSRRRLGDQSGGSCGDRGGRGRPQGDPGLVVGGEGRCPGTG